MYTLFLSLSLSPLSCTHTWHSNTATHGASWLDSLSLACMPFCLCLYTHVKAVCKDGCKKMWANGRTRKRQRKKEIREENSNAKDDYLGAIWVEAGVVPLAAMYVHVRTYVCMYVSACICTLCMHACIVSCHDKTTSLCSCIHTHNTERGPVCCFAISFTRLYCLTLSLTTKPVCISTRENCCCETGRHIQATSNPEQNPANIGVLHRLWLHVA